MSMETNSKIVTQTSKIISCLLIMILLINQDLYSQNFEGKIVYEVHYEFQDEFKKKYNVTDEQIIAQLKKDGEFSTELTMYVKDGNYLKLENSDRRTRRLYNHKKNKVYVLKKGINEVVCIKAKKAAVFPRLENLFGETEVFKVDSTKTVNSTKCELVKVERAGWKAEEHYWYNTETLEANPDHFEKHQFNYFDQVIGITNAFPVEYSEVKSRMLTVRYTMKSIDVEPIDSLLFELPAIRRTWNLNDLQLSMFSAVRPMKLKNPVEAQAGFDDLIFYYERFFFKMVYR